MFVKTHEDVIVNLSQFSSIELYCVKGDLYVIKAFKKDRARPSLENIDIIVPTGKKEAKIAFNELIDALKANRSLAWNADSSKVAVNPFSV